MKKQVLIISPHLIPPKSYFRKWDYDAGEQSAINSMVVGGKAILGVPVMDFKALL